MGLFSFLKKDTALKCDWCGREMERAAYTKRAGGKEFVFCCPDCKKSFRKSGGGKVSASCPTCMFKR